jgi:hypothetical protein
MNLVPVSSSNLSAVGYDPNTQILQVAFLNGGLYEYSGVPASVHTGLMTANSHGSYFNAHIKNGQYRYQKLR